MPTGLAVVLGMVLIGLASASPQGWSIINNFSQAFPAPVTGNFYLAFGVLGALLGFGIKLLDAPKLTRGTKLRPGEAAVLRSIRREEIRTGQKYLTKRGRLAIRLRRRR